MSLTSPLFGHTVVEDGDWAEYAACRGVDIGIFFSLDDHEQREAIELCRSCPVQQECLRYALENREMYGIWGGMRESERRGIIRERRRNDRDRRPRRDAA